MSFLDEMLDFARTVETDARAVKAAAVELAHESITVGSSNTGALGQPVGEGEHAGKLRDSFEIRELDANTTEISTDLDYAGDVEENERGLHFRSHGAHSIRMTVAGFDRIVDAATAKVAK